MSLDFDIWSNVYVKRKATKRLKNKSKYTTTTEILSFILKNR